MWSAFVFCRQPDCVLFLFRKLRKISSVKNQSSFVVLSERLTCICNWKHVDWLIFLYQTSSKHHALHYKTFGLCHSVHLFLLKMFFFLNEND